MKRAVRNNPFLIDTTKLQELLIPLQGGKEENKQPLPNPACYEKSRISCFFSEGFFKDFTSGLFYYQNREGAQKHPLHSRCLKPSSDHSLRCAHPWLARTCFRKLSRSNSGGIDSCSEDRSRITIFKHRKRPGGCSVRRCYFLP